MSFTSSINFFDVRLHFGSWTRQGVMGAFRVYSGTSFPIELLEKRRVKSNFPVSSMSSCTIPQILARSKTQIVCEEDAYPFACIPIHQNTEELDIACIETMCYCSNHSRRFILTYRPRRPSSVQ